MFASEYNNLLVTELDSQRKYFEGLLQKAEDRRLEEAATQKEDEKLAKELRVLANSKAMLETRVVSNSRSSFRCIPMTMHLDYNLSQTRPASVGAQNSLVPHWKEHCGKYKSRMRRVSLRRPTLQQNWRQQMWPGRMQRHRTTAWLPTRPPSWRSWLARRANVQLWRRKMQISKSK